MESRQDSKISGRSLTMHSSKKKSYLGLTRFILIYWPQSISRNESVFMVNQLIANSNCPEPISTQGHHDNLVRIFSQGSDQSASNFPVTGGRGSYRTGCGEHISKRPRQDVGVHGHCSGSAGGCHEASLSSTRSKTFRDQEGAQPYQEASSPRVSHQESHPSSFWTPIGTPESRSISESIPSDRAPLPSSDATVALQVLSKLCQEANWLWVDGMLLGGCLAYGLGEYHKAWRWYSRVLANDPR